MHSGLEKAEGCTRKKRSMKFRHIGYNLDPYGQSFFPKSISAWNGLAQEFAEANTLDLFKSNKVAGYGIRGNLHKWIMSFLEGRTQKVVVEGASSDPSPVKSGVPQGSVLGPLLFLLFINDLAEHTSSTVRLFADDCVMYKPVKTIQDCEVLQKDLDQLHQWEKRWQLRFNTRKCNIMRATHAKKKQFLYEYKLGGEALLPTTSTTYLGVELSSDLKWNTHVRKTATKANQTLGVLRRNLKNCQREIKNMAYKSILRP